MRFRINDTANDVKGEWYEFDGNRLLVKEARQLEEHTGMGLREFGDGLQRGKVDAIIFMVYTAKRRAGEAVQWKQFDELNIADLEMEDESKPDAEGDAEGSEEGEADRPTEDGQPPVNEQ